MHAVLKAAAAAAVMVLTATPAAHAQTLAARAGSSGLGVEVGLGVNSLLGVRANLLGGSYTREATEANIRYEGTLKLANSSLLLDLHPFAGNFRLSAGALYNNNKLDATGRADGGTYDINGVQYPASALGTLQANVRWDKLSPYVGFGWGAKPQAESGLFMTADVGAFWMKSSATLTGNCSALLPALACQQLQSDLRAEEQQFRDEVAKYKLYPVLSVGVGYRF